MKEHLFFSDLWFQPISSFSNELPLFSGSYPRLKNNHKNYVYPAKIQVFCVPFNHFLKPLTWS